MADLYMMPSVSEPFGVAPLGTMFYDVPAIIFNQSGLSGPDALPEGGLLGH